MADPEDGTMGAFAREDIRAVLARFGISSARRAVTTDSTEEVILLSKRNFTQIDAREVTNAVMAALPHTKVFVIEDHPLWATEDL
jgi:hypothetical protein